MSLPDTFYRLELVRWPCSSKEVRNVQEKVIFGENSVSIAIYMSKNLIRRSRAGVLWLKFEEGIAGTHSKEK